MTHHDYITYNPTSNVVTIRGHVIRYTTNPELHQRVTHSIRAAGIVPNGQTIAGTLTDQDGHWTFVPMKAVEME